MKDKGVKVLEAKICTNSPKPNQPPSSCCKCLSIKTRNGNSGFIWIWKLNVISRHFIPSLSSLRILHKLNSTVWNLRIPLGWVDPWWRWQLPVKPFCDEVLSSCMLSLVQQYLVVVSIAECVTGLNIVIIQVSYRPKCFAAAGADREMKYS